MPVNVVHTQTEFNYYFCFAPQEIWRMDERKRGTEKTDEFVMSFWFLFERNWLKHLETSKICQMGVYITSLPQTMNFRQLTWSSCVSVRNSTYSKDKNLKTDDILIERTLRISSDWLFLHANTQVSEVFTKLKLTGGTFLSMMVRKISIHWVMVWLFTNWSGNAYWNSKKTPQSWNTDFLWKR